MVLAVICLCLHRIQPQDKRNKVEQRSQINHNAIAAVNRTFKAKQQHQIFEKKRRIKIERIKKKHTEIFPWHVFL